jgi:hypothetical protein
LGFGFTCCGLVVGFRGFVSSFNKMPTPWRMSSSARSAEAVGAFASRIELASASFRVQDFVFSNGFRMIYSPNCCYRERKTLATQDAKGWKISEI